MNITSSRKLRNACVKANFYILILDSSISTQTKKVSSLQEDVFMDLREVELDLKEN
jgi:hypothetical protein